MRPLRCLRTPEWLACVLLLLVARPGWPDPIEAQTVDVGVGAWIGPTLMVSGVAEDASVLLGGEVGLVLGSGLRVSGAGYTLVGTVERRRPGTTPLELSMGYGGLVLHYLLGHGERWRTGVSLLAGGGTAKIRDPVAGAELGSDNFLVVEPRVRLQLTLGSFLEASASGGFRIPWSVDDLPTISKDDFRGATVTLSVSIGSFQRR